MMVEQRFRQAKRQEKLRLLDVSAELGLQAPLELLRQAIFGLDLEVASRAARSSRPSAPRPRSISSPGRWRCRCPRRSASC